MKLLDDNEDKFREMMNVNVFGMYYMMKAVLPGMQEKIQAMLLISLQYLDSVLPHRVHCMPQRNTQ